MAFSKAYLYTNRDRRNARLAKALAHPARIRIMKQLQLGEQSFQSLLEKHPLNKATLSQHLRILRITGLVDCIESNRTTYYFLLSENHPSWVTGLLGEISQLENLRGAA